MLATCNFHFILRSRNARTGAYELRSKKETTDQDSVAVHTEGSVLNTVASAAQVAGCHSVVLALHIFMERQKSKSLFFYILYRQMFVPI